MSAVDATIDFTDELKSGISVQLHVRVAKLEPATIRLITGETEKVVIKTNRRYELSAGQLEPLNNMTPTMKLNRSIIRLNENDLIRTERMLRRSLSLLRRHPHPDSIDLTFATSDVEERFRLWAQQNLTIKSADTQNPSSRSVVQALQGVSPHDSDNETAFSEDQPTPIPKDLRHSISARVGSAMVFPSRRGSLKSLRSQSEQWDLRRGSTEPSIAGGWDEVGNSSSEKGLWTWKEPPMLRKMSTTSSSGSWKRGSGSPRGEEIPALSEEAVAEGNDGSASGTAALEPPLRRHSEPPAGRGFRLEGAMGVSKSRIGNSESDVGDDFWDPLGLMSDFRPETPPAKKPVPKHGSRRDLSHSSSSAAGRSSGRAAQGGARGRQGGRRGRASGSNEALSSQRSSQRLPVQKPAAKEGSDAPATPASSIDIKE